MNARDEVVESFKRSRLIESHQRVLAMLSGGADSVCLLHVLSERITTGALAALHVNYGLRDDSGEDERFCIELCEKLGVKLLVEKVKLPGKGNLQAAAREARYRLAGEVMERERLDTIATGHTLTDQAETVIYRLASSPGRRSLIAMEPRHGDLVRPLLGVTREEARAYCEECGLAFRDDISNYDLKFARNRIRERVMPELERINSAAQRNIVATRDAVCDEDSVLADLVKQAMESIGAGGDPPSVEGKRLAQLPEALRRLVVRELAERAAGASVPLSSDRADEIFALTEKPGSAGVDIGPVRAVSEYGVLRFVAGGDRPAHSPVTLEIPGTVSFGRWEVAGEMLEEVPAEVEGGHEQATLDADLLGAEVVVRPWREGDRIRPLGLDGSKSLQDVFTDQKVPLSLRRELPVVESGGRVAWVAGIAVSDEFKLTGKTGRAVRLTARLT